MSIEKALADFFIGCLVAGVACHFASGLTASARLARILQTIVSFCLGGGIVSAAAILAIKAVAP